MEADVVPPEVVDEGEDDVRRRGGGVGGGGGGHQHQEHHELQRPRRVKHPRDDVPDPQAGVDQELDAKIQAVVAGPQEVVAGPHEVVAGPQADAVQEEPGFVEHPQDAVDGVSDEEQADGEEHAQW